MIHNIDWQTYRAVSDVLGERSSPRLAYHCGILGTMSPLQEHESASSLIGQFVEILTEELELNLKTLNLKTMQSITLDREDLNVGAEPDKCYYIANEPLVRGKKVRSKCRSSA